MRQMIGITHRIKDADIKTGIVSAKQRSIKQFLKKRIMMIEFGYIFDIFVSQMMDIGKLKIARPFRRPDQKINRSCQNSVFIYALTQTAGTVGLAVGRFKIYRNNFHKPLLALICLSLANSFRYLQTIKRLKHSSFSTRPSSRSMISQSSFAVFKYCQVTISL